MEKFIFEPISSYSFSSVIPDFPFGIKEENGIIHIEGEWWRKLTKKHRDIIVKNYRNVFVLSNNICDCKKEGKEFESFLQAYKDSFEINNWHYFISYPFLYTYNYTKEGKESVEKERIYKRIKKYFQEYNGIYIKYISGNTPKFTFNQLETELDKYNKNYIFLTPWKYDISTERKFFGIINNGKLFGITQKRCFTFLKMKRMELFKICLKITEYYGKRLKTLFYNDCVIEFFIDEDLKVFLVDIYPIDFWCNNSTGLFTLEELQDRSIIDGIIVKYLDKDSPICLNYYDNSSLETYNLYI